MLINIIVSIVNGFYIFIAVENFLTTLYSDTYTNWKEDSEAEELKAKDDEEKMGKIEKITDFATYYAPWFFILSSVLLSLCCFGILCCFKKYKKSIRKYEDSHLNPAN